MRLMNPTKILLATCAVALAGGCASTSSPNTQRGALGGAAAGAVLGGIVGHQSGEAKTGAAIGAAAGGIAGAAMGNAADRRAENAATAADRHAGYVIQQPPPAPTSAPYEPIPARPSAEAVWIAGHYDYTGDATNPYRWVPGRWETPPPGARTWVPGGWQQSGTGYVYVRGHWQ